MTFLASRLLQNERSRVRNASSGWALGDWRYRVLVQHVNSPPAGAIYDHSDLRSAAESIRAQ